MPYFEYGGKEVQHLKGRDSVLGEAMDQIGLVRREVTPQAIVEIGARAVQIY